MESGVPVFSKLGSKRLFEVVLLEAFRKYEAVGTGDLEKYCITRSPHGAPQLSVTLVFLEWLRLLQREGDQVVPSSKLRYVMDESAAPTLAIQLARLLISRLLEAKLFTAVFGNGALQLGTDRGSVFIASSRVPIDYLSLVVFLRNFGLAEERTPESGMLSVDAELAGILLNAAASSGYRPHGRGLSFAQLKLLRAAQEAQGAEAEEYVVTFERGRLPTHPRVNLIRCIASDDIAAGFDVVSFESEVSLLHDRFIEVKSFSHQEQFFWSQNEYETAKELGDAYYLYLVDMTRISDENYHPMIIRNPADVLPEAWHLEADGWIVTRRPS